MTAARVMVVVQSNPEWASFAEHVLADPSLIDDARFADNQDRIANIDELEAEIHEVFGFGAARGDHRPTRARSHRLGTGANPDRGVGARAVRRPATDS